MTTYNCPTCKKTTIYSTDNPFRPFCCERCKMIDLGEWAAEGHKISGKSAKDVMFSEEIEQLIKNGGLD